MTEVGIFFQTIFGVLVLLMFKHWLADFLLQTPNMLQGKGTYGNPYGILHSFTHGALTALVFMAVGIGTVPTAISLGVYDMLIHYHIDWAKMQIQTEPNSPKYWALFGLDQMLHHMTYVGIVFWVFVFNA